MAVPKNQDTMANMLRSIMSEIDAVSAIFEDIPLSSLWMAGGTPTFMTDEMLDMLLSHIHRRFRFIEGAQIYSESSPATLTPSKLKILLRYGLNRITVGIQTTDPGLIQLLDRRGQTKDKIREVFGMLGDLKGVIKDVDVMVGLENQTAEIVSDDMREILLFRPDNLHLFTFALSPQVLFVQRGGTMDEKQRQRQKILFDFASRILERSGYKESHYNEHSLQPFPWDEKQDGALRLARASVIGVGPGAYSHAFGSAWYFHPPFSEMGSPSGIPEVRAMESGIEEEMRGFLIKRLMQDSCVSLKAFKSLFGVDLSSVGNISRVLDELKCEGLIKIEDQKILWTIENSIDRMIQVKRLYSQQIVSAILKGKEELFRRFVSAWAGGDIRWREAIKSEDNREPCRVYYDTRVWGAGKFARPKGALLAK
jgi:oxygen-independent coproporphyrinogen-3 oxidase